MDKRHKQTEKVLYFFRQIMRDLFNILLFNDLLDLPTFQDTKPYEITQKKFHQFR